MMKNELYQTLMFKAFFILNIVMLLIAVFVMMLTIIRSFLQNTFYQQEVEKSKLFYKTKFLLFFSFVDFYRKFLMLILLDQEMTTILTKQFYSINQKKLHSYMCKMCFDLLTIYSKKHL